MTNKLRFYIITGEPGVGKTTLIKKLCTYLNSNGIKMSGFYTEEVRNNRVREGFDVVTLDGVRSRLAREQQLLKAPSKFTVGKYGVLIQEFESAALPTLQKIPGAKSCLVIDEVGKMEFFSALFKSRIKDIFSSNLDNIVLATIPIRKSDPLIEFIRSNPKSKVWVVTKDNRNTIFEDIITDIQNAFNSLLN